VSGGEFGIRGFLDAYDAKTGKLAWRCYTIPGPGEPGNETWAGESWKIGGGATWVTGAYDPDLNLIYWGTSNPSPDYNGDVRKGDNQWTASDVAIDADTGKIRWGFQFTPHDTHDWDSNQVPILIDGTFNGQPRKMLMHANRNGFYYVLDRVTGKFLKGTQFAKQTWAKGLDENGRPILIPNLDPTPEGVLVYPGLEGSTNWNSPSYSPQTGLFYVQVKENYGQYYYKLPWDYVKGEHFENGGGRNVLGEEPYGSLKALEATTGKLVWEFRQDVPGTTSPNAGVMSTASGLVFSATREGYIYALDAKTGKNLWKFQSGGAVYGSTISFMVDGKQRVAVTSGASLYVFGLD
jgi:alcohol dehydrogenase (cytochrome c)